MSKELELHKESARFTRIGNRAVKKAQEESRRLGVPNVYMHNGKIFYEKPDGEITTEDLFASSEK